MPQGAQASPSRPRIFNLRPSYSTYHSALCHNSATRPQDFLSPCAFCECLRVSLRRGRAVVVPRDVYYTSTDEQL